MENLTLVKINRDEIPAMVAGLHQEIIELGEKYPNNFDASHLIDLKVEIIGILEDSEGNKEERIAEIQGKIMDTAVKLG